MLPSQPRLLDQVRDRIRLKHYSIRTEDIYVDWIRRFILFHDKRHPREMGAAEVEGFLTHLAVHGRIAASTQNQAKSALLFLYTEVLGEELPWLDNIETAKRPARLPVVLTVEEVKAILAEVDGTGGLILHLLYGTGMRILECLRLRGSVSALCSGTDISEGRARPGRAKPFGCALSRAPNPETMNAAASKEFCFDEQ